ncbi:MAG: class I SAM-dependent methyltransferase [Sporichthyaceae bacterium]
MSARLQQRPVDVTTERGVRRSVALLRAFAVEQTQPHVFYGLLARDSVRMVEDFTSLAGRRVLDVGAGPEEFAAAFADRGAYYVGLDADPTEVHPTTVPRTAAVVADGRRLPVATASVDVTFSSNVLEHVADPAAFGDELVRVTRPGGVVVLSYTNWLSPWGGHETSPYHYLGGRRAIERYTRRYGRPPKNRVGTNLFRVSVADGLRWAHHQPDAQLLDARPRYYPSWARGLVRVPGLREVATWNLLLVLRRR